MEDQADWDSVRVFPAPPPSDLADNQTVTAAGNRYWECGHSGWHLMLGWLGGPGTLMRTPDNRDHYWDVIEHPTGSRTGRQPMPLDERREIEDSENGYLRFAGLPGDRPYGYRWFQLLPAGLAAEDIHVAANTAIDAAGLADSRYISRAVPHIRVALHNLYS